MSDRSKDHRAFANDLISEFRTAGASLVVIPEVAGIDWQVVLSDVRHSLVVTNRPSIALQLCRQGQAAIAVIGATEPQIAAVLRSRGARVYSKEGAN